MEFRMSRTLMWIGFAGGLLLMLFGIGRQEGAATLGLMLAGTGAVLAALIQAVIFYRCPHCGASLMNVRGGVPQHCPQCGEKLH